MHILKQLKNTFSNIIRLNNINYSDGVTYNSSKEYGNRSTGIRINGGNTFGIQRDSFDNNSINLNYSGKNKIEKKEENMFSFELKTGDNFAIKIHNLATSIGLIPGDDHAEFFTTVMTYFNDYLNGSLISETGKIQAGDILLFKNGYVQIKRNGQQINFVKISNKLINIISNDLGFQQKEETAVVNKGFNNKATQISGKTSEKLIVFREDKEEKLKIGNEHLLDGIFKDGLGMNDLDLGKLSGELTEYEQSYIFSVMQKDLHIGKLTAGAKKREQIIRSMEKASLIKIIGGTEIIFNTKNAIKNLEFVPDVETLRESFGADIYNGSLESVVLVQLYLKTKGADIKIDGIIGDETFDAIRQYNIGFGTFANNVKIKHDLVDKKVEILVSTELDERNIDAGLFEFPVSQLQIHLNKLFKKQDQKPKKNGKKTSAISVYPDYIELSAIQNTLNILKNQIVAFKEANKISNFKLISASVNKLSEDVKNTSEFDSSNLKTWANSLISVVKDLKDKYIGITYDDAQKIIDIAFINKKGEISLAAEKLSDSIPGKVSKKQLELMIISDLKKQIGTITISLSILRKLTRKELTNQINELFEQKIIEITTQIANRKHVAKVSLSSKYIKNNEILAIKQPKGINKMYAGKIKNRKKQENARIEESYEKASIGATKLAKFLKDEGYPKYMSGATCGGNVGEALLAMGIPGLPKSGRDGYKWTLFLENNQNFKKRKVKNPTEALPGEILVYNKGFGRTKARQDFGHVEIKTFDGYFYGGRPKQRAGGSTRSGFTGYAYSPVGS